MTFDQIKRNFDRKLWTASQVQMCVRKGLISQAQADASTGENPISQADMLTPDEVISILTGEGT